MVRRQRDHRKGCPVLIGIDGCTCLKEPIKIFHAWTIEKALEYLRALRAKYNIPISQSEVVIP